MKTLLIPVDFSQASGNAVAYAAQLCRYPEYEIGRVVLLHSYYVSIYEQILPSPDLLQVGEEQIQARRQEVKEKLLSIKKEVFSGMEPAISVEAICSELPLMRGILQEIDQKKPALVVMGTNSPDAPGESYIGDQVIRIARISPVPVLAVPVGWSLHGINRAVLACDFKTLTNLNLLKSLEDSHHWLKKDLLVLNVDPELKRARPDEKFQQVSEQLDRWLTNIPHSIYYSDEPDILRGILDFAKEKEADLIIALPGRHSFLYSLTHQSISQALSVTSQRPVLILK